MSKETGGPAFSVQGYEGLTMRDYFAAKAMQGDWACQSDRIDSDIDTELLKGRAKVYYRMADEMLAARASNI